MPTTRPRLAITETEQIARALDDAAKLWPQVTSRSKLLMRLLEEGHRAILGQHKHDISVHQGAVARTKGALTGLYGPDYLQELREDWPT